MARKSRRRVGGMLIGSAFVWGFAGAPALILVNGHADEPTPTPQRGLPTSGGTYYPQPVRPDGGTLPQSQLPTPGATPPAPGEAPSTPPGAAAPGSEGAPAAPGTPPSAGTEGTAPPSPASTPTTPEAAPPSTPAAPAAGAGAGAQGAGGGAFAAAAGESVASAGGAFNMIGDRLPYNFVRRQRFTPLSQVEGRLASSAVGRVRAAQNGTLPPPVPPEINPSDTAGAGVAELFYRLSSVKIADNQSPRPQDRFFYTFNYFNDIGADYNKRSLAPYKNVDVYHQLFGIEKTFLDEMVSVGLRLPVNTVRTQSQFQGYKGSDTDIGHLSIFLKGVLWQDDKTGNLVSMGLNVTAPTGPGAFAGSSFYPYYRTTAFQPFLGYIYNSGDFFVHGFSAVDIPVDDRDVTMMFNDVGIGYMAYRDDHPNAVLTALVPTFEVHINTPLNHRGFDYYDLASTPDIVNLTFGGNIELFHNTVLTGAYVRPLTGPVVFDYELVAQVNVFFGRRRQSAGSLASMPMIR